MSFDTELAHLALAEVSKGGAEYADLFWEKRTQLSLRLEDGRIEDVVGGLTSGASLRLLRGGETYFGFAESPSRDRLLVLARDLRAAASVYVPGSASLPAAEASEVAGSPLVAEAVIIDDATLVGDARMYAGLLRIVDQAARELSSEVIQVAAILVRSLQDIFVANLEGRAVVDRRSRLLLAVTVMARRGDILQTGRETHAIVGTDLCIDEKKAREVAESAARRAIAMLDARPAPAGRMPVVLASGFGGVLFHEACGHGLEADYLAKGATVWAELQGKRVASKVVTAYDDGTLPGAWGTSTVDDEGTASQKTVLIEEGILTNFMSDRLRAAKLRIPLTGNGRRQDYRFPPFPRMTNTYFAPQDVSPQEIIADTPHGLYAKSLSGGEVNPATGDFVFSVSEGYLIENGKLTTPVRGATLIGNGLEVLKNIDAVGNDLELEAGACGKEGQSVPVGTGQPTVRVAVLTVGGTQQ